MLDGTGPHPAINSLALCKGGTISSDVRCPPTCTARRRHRFFPFLCLPLPVSFSQSSFHSFSPGANVYISCNRLLHGAPEFILQPVVMARFLD